MRWMALVVGLSAASAVVGCDEGPSCKSGAAKCWPLTADADAHLEGDTQADTKTPDAADDDVPAPPPPDWSTDAALPASGERTDIYGLGPALPAMVHTGLGYAHAWPVDVTGVRLPWRLVATIFDPDTTDETTLSAQSLARSQLGFGTTTEMYDWLGLPVRGDAPEAFPGVPWPADLGPGDRVGAGLLDTEYGQALTFSCATCHTARAFGRTVVGATNRRSRANAFFGIGKTFFPLVSPELAVELGGATEDEITLLLEAQGNLPAIGYKQPVSDGLDTSLAQVALSLARRNDDAWATRNPAFETSPRPNLLDDLTADSKPAVWWSLKYKTRWLSDGSLVSGNPVFTNFLWNELGRGTDLQALSDWLDANPDVVQALTALVFATPAPRWTDFFPDQPIDLAAAKRGKALFDGTCASCHGTYDKAWDDPSAADPFLTTRVTYHAQTPVLDVGTDPQRAQGMAGFADALNALEISKRMDTVVEVQTGYVPPPLEGIFLRYPYLHNQSVPNLCALLTPAAERPTEFWLGPDEDPATDYDMACVGLPTGDAVPAAWKDVPRARMDTTLPGLSNQGHDAFLLDGDGNPRFRASERADLIAFLKTL